MGRALSVVLGCGLLACSLVLEARQDAGQAIPAEVVSLLMTTGMTGSSAGELRSGGPPADFPSGLFPPGSIVNATLVSPTRGTVVIATAAKLSMAEFEAHGDRLTSGGWQTNGPRMTGFMSSNAPNAINVCRNADFVNLTAHRRESGGLFVRATLTRDPRRTCVPMPGMTMFADIDIPRLVLPAGARQVGGGGSSSGNDAMSSTIRLEASIPPAAVAEHYEKLLVAAGWKVIGRLRDGDGMVFTRFEVPSRAGLPLVGAISAMRLPETGDLDVFLRVVRATRDPRTPGLMPAVGITGGLQGVR